MLRRLNGRPLAVMMLAMMALASSCMAGGGPRSIILLIGDGMGIGHITAARCAGPGRDGRLAIDTMPVTGLALTHSANALVTDSAAAGTALATGVKTTNGTISLTPDGKRVESVLELAREMGKSTGGARSDERNLLDEARKLGFDVVETAEAMTASASDRIIGLFAQSSMTSERPEPTVAEMTSKAISTLSRNPKAFFMMSEGAKIDSEAHANNAAGVVKEMLMFDDAVRAALDFAKKDKATLVVVTADHNTAGMSVQEPNKENPKFTAGWASGGHSANMVAIYAFGPGAEQFTGTHDNTEIPRIMARLWGKKLN